MLYFGVVAGYRIKLPLPILAAQFLWRHAEPFPCYAGSVVGYGGASMVAVTLVLAGKRTTDFADERP